LSRKLLSLGGNLYTRLMLGIPIKDATGGFRAFTADAVKKIQLLERDTQGYIFQVENTYLAVKRGLKVVEVPIEFIERVVGTSKMSRAIVIEALARVTIWGLRNRILRQPLV
jgi:dolichol-phosphate mannosyltransferase